MGPRGHGHPRQDAPALSHRPDLASRAGCLEALSSGFAAPAVATGVGGSIPILAEASEALGGIPALITAVAYLLTNAYGPDESPHLPSFVSACRGEVVLLALLAEALAASTTT